MSSATRYALFVSVTPGLEGLLEEELAGLLPGARLRTLEGGIEVRVSPEELWLVAACTRLGESLRVRVGRFRATSFRELEEGLGRVPFSAYLNRGTRPPVRVTCHKSRLYHSDAVAERVVKCLVQQPGASPEDPEAPTVFVRIVKDRVVVSVDASGELLHRRGYRVEVGTAPMRETLAAACVRAAALSPDQPIWDPFCGSGTLLIESVAMSRGAPVQMGNRPRAFQRWPCHDAAAYGDWSAPSEERRGRAGWASDLDPRATERCRRNAERAGIDEGCTFLTGDFQDVAPQIPEGAAVVGNLPYGKRVKLREPKDTLRRLGKMLQGRLDLAPVLLVDGVGTLPRLTGLSWDRAGRFSNRGKSVTLWRLKR